MLGADRFKHVDGNCVGMESSKYLGAGNFMDRIRRSQVRMINPLFGFLVDWDTSMVFVSNAGRCMPSENTISILE
jgi:hypothetical protein